MMPTLSEIILLIVIILLVSGLAKASDIGAAVGRMRAKFLEGMEEEDDETIDITPPADGETEAETTARSSHD